MDIMAKMAKLRRVPVLNKAPDSVMQAIEGMPAITTTDLKNQFGKVIAQAEKSGLAILSHRRPRFVLLPIERFASMQEAEATALQNLTTEFDELVKKMQTPAAKRAAHLLFKATPADLGRAAVKAAHAR